MGFWNDVGLCFGIEPVTVADVQHGNYRYSIDDTGDVYRQPIVKPRARVWVRVDPEEVPPEARETLKERGIYI